MINAPLSLLLVGYHKESLKSGYKTLLEQVEIHRQHSPVFELASSMSEHLRIPASFDGDADAFATRPAETSCRPALASWLLGLEFWKLKLCWKTA